MSCRLRGSVQIEHTIARLGAERLWKLMRETDYVNALGALTGGQAIQQVQAGLKAIYCSGWQVAADANVAGQMYPDQSLYPANSVPELVKKINNSLQRTDQIYTAEGKNGIHWFAPILADAEAGFGGNLNAFELMKSMIDAGAAGVHFEDQLSSAKKCGHMGGKVLVPTSEAVQKLVAARLAADVCGVPTVLFARTDADAANLLTSDVDENDKPFCTGERTPEGFYHVQQRSRTGDFARAGLRAVCRSRLVRNDPSRISNRRENLPKRFTQNFRTKCWLITVRRHLTGRKNSMMKRLQNFRTNSEKWVTNFNLLLWLVSIRLISRCSNWRKIIKPNR